MSKKNKIAIFFGDMTEEGQKRVATQGLTEISEYSKYAPSQIEVDTITVDDDAYGYDEDPKKQELLDELRARIATGQQANAAAGAAIPEPGAPVQGGDLSEEKQFAGMPAGAQAAFESLPNIAKKTALRVGNGRVE